MPSEPAHDATPPDGAPDARIEQLLDAGLDHYFASQFDQAINVWTRVVFLDRGNTRARAYIDRARQALAEQQRQAEEFVARGVAAYDAGAIQEARVLFTRAVDLGGPSDTALLYLGRLSRLDGAAHRALPATSGSTRADPGRHRAGAGLSRWAWTVAVLGFCLVAGYVGVRMAAEDGLGPAAAVVRDEPEPLPVIRPHEVLARRARQRLEAGDVRGAAAALAALDVSGVPGPDLDRLREDVQRRLLALGGEPAADPTGGPR
ncbi:MAG: hypothetical protein HOP14_09570 [Acidobacteria bacterium]|nr:hypothetical protein [Acidobacteriota bacterium]